MNTMSDSNRSWHAFRELRRVFVDPKIPNRFYHYEGIRSPYTTEMDDLHDLAEIAAIVGTDRHEVWAAADRTPSETHKEYFDRMERLISDLRHLQEALRSLAGVFISECDKARHNVGARLKDAYKEWEREQREQWEREQEQRKKDQEARRIETDPPSPI